MSSTMSILGLYDYDSTIFDQMALPAEINTNKNTLIDNLLMECAEFEILYTDPNFMKYAIKAWSGMMVGIWEKQLATTKYQYDPISNYDRNENYTDTITGTQNSTRTPNLTDELSNGLVQTSAQNSYENAGMVDAVKTTNSGKDTTTHTGNEQIYAADNRTVQHYARAYGNIGVTTTQQMIEQERDVILFNMFEIIINDFKERFCLMIY